MCPWRGSHMLRLADHYHMLHFCPRHDLTLILLRGGLHPPMHLQTVSNVLCLFPALHVQQPVLGEARTSLRPVGWHGHASLVGVEGDLLCLVCSHQCLRQDEAPFITVQPDQPGLQPARWQRLASSDLGWGSGMAPPPAPHPQTGR